MLSIAELFSLNIVESTALPIVNLIVREILKQGVGDLGQAEPFHIVHNQRDDRYPVQDHRMNFVWAQRKLCGVGQIDRGRRAVRTAGAVVVGGDQTGVKAGALRVDRTAVRAVQLRLNSEFRWPRWKERERERRQGISWLN